MKTKVIIFALLLISNFAIGQENYLWPIPGKQAGQGILYRPQDYIGVADAQSQAELNFGDLIIGATLGTPVLCPVDGIYAYLAQKPFCTNLRKIVNKKGGFLCFGSCPIDDDQDVLYAGYEPLPNGEGFVKDEPEWRESDSLVNYKGRLYLLTNETSFSASTCFAGWVKKQNRGVIVGRETGSAYHQMKAENFTQYLLPNSDIAIQIPTIKVVFDSVVNERFPNGRGVLPDYPVNFTPEELSFVHGDSILNYTLQLIRDGQYIYYVEPEPETTSVEEDARPFHWWWVAIGVTAVGLVTGMIWKKKRL